MTWKKGSLQNKTAMLYSVDSGGVAISAKNFLLQINDKEKVWMHWIFMQYSHK